MKDHPDLFSQHQSVETPAAVGVLFVDTETTGPDPATAEVCEIGAVLVTYEGDRQVEGSERVFSRLVRPSEPIPPEASAVHHITNRMVESAPAVAEVSKELEVLASGADYFCAHNASFDLDILKRQLPALFGRFGPDGVLDTLRLARHLWPRIPSHSLQVLRYRFELDEGLDGDAHRALFDAQLVRRLIDFARARGLLPDGGWKALVDFAITPLEVATFGFGKYRGCLVEDIIVQDPQYVRWLLGQLWIPSDYPDLYHTLLRKMGPGERLEEGK